jgi:cell division septal protein FtsQ
MKKKKFKIPLKLISLTAIICLVLTAIMVYTFRFLKTSEYFKIKDVVTRDASNINLSYLKGKNIFSIDLKRESNYILEYFPECKNVRLVRLLPNRIFVDLIRRKPLAIVKLYRYFVLDEEGVLLDVLVEPEESALPIITGLETKIFGAKPGKKCNVKELTFALNIIKEIKKSKRFRDYRIKTIDASNLNNASIFIIPPSFEFDYPDVTLRYEGLEVKLNSDRIAYKVTLLANLVAAARKELSNIKYIDLRFKEPVIKFKDAQ